MPSTKLQVLAKVAQRTAVLVFVADVIHCFRFISAYYVEDEQGGKRLTEDELQAEDDRIVDEYRSNCGPDAVVSTPEFEASVQQALDLMEREAKENGFDSSLKSRLMSTAVKVNREAITFAGGGRATYMQLAHPFIAAGIRDHSYLQRGVSRRFFNTFKYMFGLAFGTGEEVAKAARAIRGLHAKVNGEIQEEVGAFSAKARFDANQKDAMRYVQWTLSETAVFEYELHVGWLTEEEKNELARFSSKFLLLFGVPPLPGDDTITWKQFLARLRAIQRSKLITVSDTALDTQEYILLPPAPMYAPLMNFVKYSTLVSLPPKLGFQFGGRMYTSWADRLLFAIAHAVIRFLYRLTPGGFRFLGAYWGMWERVNGPRPFLTHMLAKMSGKMVRVFLAILMPDRDPEVAIEKVKEIRSHREPFDKLEGAPAVRI